MKFITRILVALTFVLLSAVSYASHGSGPPKGKDVAHLILPCKENQSLTIESNLSIGTTHSYQITSQDYNFVSVENKNVVQDHLTMESICTKSNCYILEAAPINMIGFSPGDRPRSISIDCEKLATKETTSVDRYEKHDYSRSGYSMAYLRSGNRHSR